MCTSFSKIKNIVIYEILVVIITILLIIIYYHTYFDYISSSIYSFNHIKNKSYTIPNIVWLFWDGKLSNSVSFFLHDLKEKLISYNIVFICNSTIFNYINWKDLPPKLTQLPNANQVDYYKFYLTYNYGGIWMDCSMYLNNESFLNKFIERVKKKHSLLGGFNYLFHPNYHIETGFIISPRYSSFIKGILKEIYVCIEMGRKKYMNKRLDEGIIMKSNVVVSYKGKKRKLSPYFYVYVCIQTALQRDFHGNVKLELLKAEDYMYKIHTFCDWDRFCIKKKWDEEEEVRSDPIIKFNHDNRDLITLPKVDII